MDDLLVVLGILVMIEQEAVLWSRGIYQSPTLGVFYTVVLSGQTMVWYVHSSFSGPFARHLRVFTLFRLARGSILTSIIRIMSGGPLRVGALYISGLFVVFYVVIIAQFVWVCETNLELDGTGYVPSFGSDFRVVSASPHVMNGPHPVFHGA